MSASALIPQFTLEAEVNRAGLTRRRLDFAEAGHHLSFSDAVVAACARGLLACPQINASFDGDSIIHHREINIGVAVALPDGLVAPAIRNADQLSLAELAAERKRLTAAAMAGKLKAEELLSTTFTISNLGRFAIPRFRALVVPPQAAILAIGAPSSDGLVTLALSCDHRVFDGAPAAGFMVRVVDLLDNPDWIDESHA
jgi:pyruvate dehydrogenase E2 component (dihydrolipoamide acetyltransferase)